MNGMLSSWSRARWHDTRVNLAAHPFAWPASRLLRRLGPVVRVPRLGVVINDATIAHDLLVRDDVFVKQGKGSIAAMMTAIFGSSALANMDGEAHRGLRQRLGPLASADVGEQWFTASRSPLDDCLVRLARGERVDLALVSRVLAGRLTLTLLGLGATGRGAAADDDAALTVHALGERIAATLRLSPDATSMDAARADAATLLALAEGAFARRDLPNESLGARLRALGCDADETRGILSIFFVAGALTLAVALPRAVALLADDHRLQGCAGDAAATAAAVDEAMRYACPVPATMRIAARATQLGGVLISAGERVVILTANLARDPRLFPRPDRFDVSRPAEPRARYLWYGAGAHFCLGFPLAQRVMRQAVAEIAAVGALRVVRRRAARGVLLPAWDMLELQGAGR